MTQCTCNTDKEATCIVHPTTRSLKERIAELEARELGFVQSLRTLEAELEDTVTECMSAKSNEDIIRAENKRLRERVQGIQPEWFTSASACERVKVILLEETK